LKRKAKIGISVGVDVEFLLFTISTWTAKTPAHVLGIRQIESSASLGDAQRRSDTQEYYGQSEEDQQAGGPIVDLDAFLRKVLFPLKICKHAPVGAGTILYAHFASSCLMICAGTHGYVITTDGRLVLMRSSARPGERCRVVGTTFAHGRTSPASLPLRFDASKTLRIQRMRLPAVLMFHWRCTTAR
jgi:hypothetical protein